MLTQLGPYHSAGTGLATELAWTREHAARPFAKVVLIIIHKQKTEFPPHFLPHTNILDYRTSKSLYNPYPTLVSQQYLTDETERIFSSYLPNIHVQSTSSADTTETCH